MPGTALTALQMQTMRPGPGAHIEHLLGARDQLDPFIMADHFRMWQPTFGPHPHAGFSAVTYLFEDSATGFRNRDSQGHQNRIEAGDLHWTMAGAGLLHEEIPLVPGLVAHGLQIFVNLPAYAKHKPPTRLHVSNQDITRLALGDAQARLVFGHWGDQSADVAMPAPGDATLLDLWLPAAGEVTLQLEAGRQAVLLHIEGSVDVNAQAQAGHTAWAVPAGGQLHLRASPGGASRMALLAGTPWREPLVMHGPFGMSSPAELQATMARYQAGEMGRLLPAPL
jgi:redox-sensitive bicupin YhaK (pirin superfamily)